MWYGSHRKAKTYKTASVSRPTDTQKKASRVMSYTKETILDLSSECLEGAIRGMDTLAMSNMQHFELCLMNRRASWRSKPPTVRQLATLSKLGMDIPQAVHDWASSEAAAQPKTRRTRTSTTVVKLSSALRSDAPPVVDMTDKELITRGSAMNLILRLTHGSSKAWGDLKKAKDRIEAQSLKTQDSVKRAVWTTN
ncbi:hypothetical protein GGH92_010792 [Coemansia sp. RSA 2673]|nr:hypothetical protein GGH92_010792 [Coemansia sp. RSA 2673]